MKRFSALCVAVWASYASPVAGQLALPDVLMRQGSGGLPDSAEASDRFGAAFSSGDFDGDGYADLAIGIPGENSRAGAVQVIYGSADGLNTARQTLIRQSDLPVNGEGAESEDQFGKAVAAGDFNGDSFDDLAIGAPLEHVGSILDCGAVSVIYGQATTGLDLATAQYWTQDSTGIADSAENGDQFGAALAVGDFNHDLRDDLAVGSPKESLPGASQAGVVHVLSGSVAGLTGTGSAYMSQLTFTLEPESGEGFGGSLATGRFDVDTYDDLAIGAPADNLWPNIHAGSVQIVFGSAGGVTSTDSVNLTLPSYAEADAFGVSLAVGHFNGDTFEDLAVGAPGRDFPEPPATATATNSGRVVVYYGASSKVLVGSSTDSVRQGLSGFLETPETGDGFGYTLGTGRYSDESNELDYLVIGAPQEGIDGAIQAGAVHVVYPSASGIATADFHQLFHQNVADFGASESCEAFDLFGSALGSGDFDNDGNPDLVIGVPDEDFGATDTGIIHVLKFPITLDDIFSDGFESNDTLQWSSTCPDTCGE